MKLKQINTAREVVLPGIRVELVTEGTNIKELILSPENDDRSYSVRPADTYSATLKLYQRLEFETKTVYRLKGVFMGLKVHEDHDTESKAIQRRSELDVKDIDALLEIVPVEIRVDESGEPVPGLDNDIPF